MKMSLFVAPAIALALAAGSAFAADMPYRKEAPYFMLQPSLSWTGFYGGLNVGGGWSATRGGNQFVPFTDPALPGSVFVLPGNNSASNSGGVVGGGQLGFDYQFGSSIVIGAETDFQGTSIDSGDRNPVTALASPFVPGSVLIPLSSGNNVGLNLPWFGTVRGRAGFLITPSLLIYGTGGFAYGEVQGNLTGFSNTRTGWTAGGGVEWLFLPDWSAKAEYLFVDLSSGGTSSTFGFQSGAHHHPEVNIIRTGVNYHFNFGNVGSFGGLGAPIAKPLPTVPYG